MSPSSQTSKFRSPSGLHAASWHVGRIGGGADIHVCVAYEEYRQATGGCLTSDIGRGRIVGACDGEIVAGRCSAVGEKTDDTPARTSVVD